MVSATAGVSPRGHVVVVVMVVVLSLATTCLHHVGGVLMAIDRAAQGGRDTPGSVSESSSHQHLHRGLRPLPANLCKVDPVPDLYWGRSSSPAHRWWVCCKGLTPSPQHQLVLPAFSCFADKTYPSLPLCTSISSSQQSHTIKHQASNATRHG